MYHSMAKLWEKINVLQKLVTRESCLFIGETGLDKFKENLPLQEEYFRRHIEISEKLKKPLIIHSVRTTEKVLTLKKEMKAKQPWIFHDFNGNEQIIKRLVKDNCYLSLGKNFLKESSKIRKATDSVPLQSLFFETDEMKIRISEIYQTFATLRKIELNELTQQIRTNFKSLIDPVE